MHKDTVVADIKNNELEIINQGLLPLYLKRNGSLETWIASRAIDAHRPHSRLIKRILRLSAADDCEVALKVNAATITDNWWIKQTAEESLKYKDVRFSVNYFDNLALKGDPDSIERINHPEILTSRSPELTNIGSFEKCWKLENQEWWLYKLSNAFQTFSELFIFEMGSMLGFDMAYFEPWESGTKTLDFTENAKYDFEPAFSLVGEEVDYFDHPNTIGFVRLGDSGHADSGLAVVISNGEDGEKTMSVGENRKGEVWHEITGSVKDTVTIDEEGKGCFLVKGGKLAVWVKVKA